MILKDWGGIVRKGMGRSTPPHLTRGSGKAS